jgi:lipid II:glycine glycyltransferase (peptidoglycan interpeptide bridge formation enzyme)
MANFLECEDFATWETELLTAANFTFLQGWQYGELWQDIGYQRRRFLVEEGGKRVLLFQVAVVSARRGKVLQLRHAPIFLRGFSELTPELQRQVVTETLNFLKDLAKSYNCDFIRLQALVELESQNPLLAEIKRAGFKPAHIHNIDAEKTLILDITPEAETLLGNMRKQTRYYIRRAEKDGVSVKLYTDISAVDRFFKIHEDTTQRQNFVSYSLDYYRKSFAYANSIPESKLRAEVFLAEYQGVEIAGAIVVFMGEKAFYSDGGSLTAYSKIPASYAIQWRAIQRAKELGCKSYNFWGGVSPDKENTNYPWYGIDLFKRGFGGERVDYMHAHDLGLTWKYNLTRIWETIEKTRRGY